jgi:UDP:flavonoid glycosyltransferase YjiC (YdhE family)
MKILFAVVDGGGNIPPQLAVARALRARGAHVHFVGHQGVRERVEADGFPFEPFGSGRNFDPIIRRSLPAIMSDFARVAMDRRIGECVVETAQRNQADAVVVDMILTAGIAALLESGIPTVVFVHCFYRAVQDQASGPIGRIMRLRGISPLDAEKSCALQIVSARDDLDPVRGAPPVHHVGVVWQGVPRAAVAAPTPRILVSLSTCAFAGQRRMLQSILDAVGALPVEVTVTVGPGIDAAGLRVPANASIHAWLDHDEVLATASLVIGHGGHSTTMRALSFGVPLVVMPANLFIDQKRVGGAVESVGAGILLSKHARADRIRAAIETVLGDPAYRESAGLIGAKIRERDGAAVAADTIGEFVNTHRRNLAVLD